VALYSRDLKEITTTFHDVPTRRARWPAMSFSTEKFSAMRGEEVLPFAELQKRLGRREHDLFLRDEVPIQFIAFDLLWLNDESKLNQPLRERRRLLEQLAPLPTSFRLARITQANSADEIEAAFNAARDRGNEGLIAKRSRDCVLARTPRTRVAETQEGPGNARLRGDCAEYGHGKRNKVLSDYTFAVRDERTGELKTIGKAYSGLTDAEIARLTKHFQIAPSNSTVAITWSSRTRCWKLLSINSNRAIATAADWRCVSRESFASVRTNPSRKSTRLKRPGGWFLEGARTSAPPVATTSYARQASRCARVFS
jgi:hypothetical protein